MLTQLEAEYSVSTDGTMQLLYSKLAVLEFCGWIEVSLDDLWLDYVQRKLVNPDNIKRINRIINKNYGFEYDNNIYPTMCSVLGVNNWENILDSFPTTAFINMKSVLSSYKDSRNQAAHTNTIPGVTHTYWAPSVVQNDYMRIKPAFQYLEYNIVTL